MTTKNAYIEAMKSQLDELNANMNLIDAKAQEAKGDARDAYHEEMRKLRHQSKLAVAKFRLVVERPGENIQIKRIDVAPNNGHAEIG